MLPELAVCVVDGVEAGTLADSIIESLWRIFDEVRQLHGKVQDTNAAILVWSWPGERTDRPVSPSEMSPAVTQEPSSLSLLPALSGLLRCMALELKRSIVLLCTDKEPRAADLRDATAFLTQGGLMLGDYTLSHHRLTSYEPRMMSTETVAVNRQDALGGHILSLGGARGIVAEMLTRLTSPHSHLSVVGRSATKKPDPELIGLSKKDLLRILLERHKQCGNQASITPRSLQYEADQIQRQSEIQQQLEKLRQLVATFDYNTLDLSDAQEFQALLGQERMADINVMISGAGVIEDQSCLTKSKDSFQSVLRTKVVPLCVLLSRGLPPTLRTWISFSSIASKSGNPGQADYAAANEFLNTVIHWFSRRYPDICMRTINWGPWQGSGMATPEVLDAFKTRGLEAIDPQAAADTIREILKPTWSAVEVSAIALNPEIKRRVQMQQWLSANSALWKYHSAPVVDALATDTSRLIFHDSIPYIQGHRKNGRGVVPAALILCLAADLAASLQTSTQPALQISLYVYNGITIPDSSTVSVLAQAQASNDGSSGLLNVTEHDNKRPHYRVSWAWTDEWENDMQWQFSPTNDGHELSYCEPSDVYKACLFHSGVMARLSDRVVIDQRSRTSWCKARPAAIVDQLGTGKATTDVNLPIRDLTLVDALLQLLLVQTIETCGFSALPQEISMILLKSMPAEEEVQLTITIVQVEGSCLEAIGACRDINGDLLFVMKPSKFTISEDLLDYTPGIIRRVGALE